MTIAKIRELQMEAAKKVKAGNLPFSDCIALEHIIATWEVALQLAKRNEGEGIQDE